MVAVDGVIKLAVNGKFVNGISRSTKKKGDLCLESEGAEIHFRNIRIMELPPGVPYTLKPRRPRPLAVSDAKGFAYSRQVTTPRTIELSDRSTTGAASAPAY